MNTPVHLWMMSKLDHVSKNCLHNADVLEIGCLGGVREYFHPARKRIGAYVGIDVVDGTNVDMVIDTSVEMRKWPWNQKDGTCWDYPSDPKRGFEIVVCMNVLQHTSAAEAIVRNVFRCLEIGGMVFFATGNDPSRHDLKLTSDLLATWMSDFSYVEIEDMMNGIEGNIYGFGVRS